MSAGATRIAKSLLYASSNIIFPSLKHVNTKVAPTTAKADIRHKKLM